MNDVTKDLLEALKCAKNSLVAFKFLPGDANRWEESDEANLAAVDSAIARAEAALAAPQPDAVAPARLVVIPSYDESKTAVEDGNATALHAFICDNEPADLELEKVFRETLQAVLNDAVGVFKP